MVISTGLWNFMPCLHTGKWYITHDWHSVRSQCRVRGMSEKKSPQESNLGPSGVTFCISLRLIFPKGQIWPRIDSPILTNILSLPPHTTTISWNKWNKETQPSFFWQYWCNMYKKFNFPKCSILRENPGLGWPLAGSMEWIYNYDRNESTHHITKHYLQVSNITRQTGKSLTGTVGSFVQNVLFRDYEFFLKIYKSPLGDFLLTLKFQLTFVILKMINLEKCI